MSTIKSSAENLTLNADGSNNDIIFQSNGSNVATLDQAGLLTATTFAGSGASLTALPAAQLTGSLPAISGASLTGITTGKVLRVEYVSANAGSTTTTSWANTGLNHTVTPASTGSRFLLLFSANYEVSNIIAGGAFGFGKNSTNIKEVAKYLNYQKSGNPNLATGQMVDSPNTTSAITYNFQHRLTIATGSLITSANSIEASFILIEIGA